jgi:hypothetical protein
VRPLRIHTEGMGKHGLRWRRSPDKASQVGVQSDNIEVHQQSNLATAQAQAGQKLGFVNALQSLDGTGPARLGGAPWFTVFSVWNLKKR